MHVPNGRNMEPRANGRQNLVGRKGGGASVENGGAVLRKKTPSERNNTTTRARTSDIKQSFKPKDKRDEDGLIKRITNYVIENQISLSLTILLTIHSAYYLLPSSQNAPTLPSKFTSLMYYNPSTKKYGAGWDDMYLVLYWIVAFTLLRDGAMKYIFRPYAAYGGIQSSKGQIRFAEQAWLMLYYTVYWTIGMYLMYNGPHWFKLNEFWTGWPLREISGFFKWYYLTQLAFWLQQIFVLHIEARRKDHYQMLAHHIITSVLLISSYAFHMTKVGNAILCAMDVVDILLPLAKLLRYLGYQKLCDIAFFFFLVTWVVSRHVFYLFILASVYFDSGRIITYACYAPGSPKPIPTPSTPAIPFLLGGKYDGYPDVFCYTSKIRMAFFTLLAMLQVITLVWLYMIFRVAYKVITGTGAEDTRSDDEDQCEDDEEEEVNEANITEEKTIAAGLSPSAGVSTGAFSTLIMNGAHSHRRISSSGGGKCIS